MRALVILADRRAGSICHLAAERAVAALARDGHEVTVRDLYGENFRAAMSAAEREAYHGDTPILDPHVGEHAAELTKAEILVFVYPSELSTLPAILKGWLERVFVPGVGFVFDDRHKVRPGLRQVRRIVGISTYDERRLEVKVTHDNGRRTIARAVRMSTGLLATRTAWVALYSAGSATTPQVEAFLRRCARRVTP